MPEYTVKTGTALRTRFNSSGNVPMTLLLIAALVVVLVPVCAMSMCAPVGGSHMGGGLSSLLDCEHMYFPSDAPPALILEAFALLFVAALMLPGSSSMFPALVRESAVASLAEDPPDPPGDPLSGRLLI